MTGHILFVLLAFGFAVVVFAPETEVGKSLRRALVEAPAQLLNGGPMKILVAILVLGALAALTVGAPELVALVGMADLSIYLDIAVLSLILGAVTALKTTIQSAVETGRRVVTAGQFNRGRLGQRRVRSRRTGGPRLPASDADGGWRPVAWRPA